MYETNYLKLLWFAGFVAFASLSCWATAESLHLLLSTWPIIMCYVVSIGFFIIASLGTKMIVDSLNSHIYLTRRGLRLTGGILLIIVFWLLFSMPTNTHTFFYRTAIDDIVSSDILQTQGYLRQVRENTNNVEQARRKVVELKQQVDNKLIQLCQEIKNPANPGYGPEAIKILKQFADIFGVANIQPLSVKGTTPKQLDILCDAERERIYGMYEEAARNIIVNIAKPSEATVKQANNAFNVLGQMKLDIDGQKLDLNDADHIRSVCNKLNDSYNVVKQDSLFINFKNEDKSLYCVSQPVTKVTRMLSVYYVWWDYFKGKFAGYGLFLWVILSILVDIAAFIFFDLAFHKTEE